MKQSNYKLTFLKISYLLILALGFAFSFFYGGGLDGFKRGLKDGEGRALTELPYLKLEPVKKDTIKLISTSSSDSIFFGVNYYTTAYIQGNNLSNKLLVYDFLKGIPTVAIAVLGVLLFITIYKFISAIASRQVFTLKNINRLVSMGWIFIIMNALFPLFEYLSYLGKVFAFEGQPYKVIPDFDVDFSSAMFGIILLTVAYAFKKGLQLQQENDLTV